MFNDILFKILVLGTYLFLFELTLNIILNEKVILLCTKLKICATKAYKKFTFGLIELTRTRF